MKNFIGQWSSIHPYLGFKKGGLESTILWMCFCFSTVAFAQNITYHEHIAPILEKNCVPCHQATEIGAMPLTTYEEVASYGQMIAYVTKTGLMPPFLADQSAQPIKGEKRLTAEELGLIEKWLLGGLQKGEKRSGFQQSKTFAIPQLMDVDQTFAMSESFEQYGIYYDQYRVFSIPTNLKEDKYVSAIEFVPGNKKIVRQVMISVDTSDRIQVLDDWDPQYGYFSFGELGFVPMESRWYSWNPTQPFTEFPKGMAKFLPKNAKLLVHIHYGPTGVPAKDSSIIRLKFADKKPEKIIQTAALIHRANLTNDTFFIPANEVVRFHAKFTVPFDMELLGLFPQAHYLGRKWEIFTVEPNTQQAKTLLKIMDWDFHWKQFFEFDQPVILRKGTIVHALAEYDNTSKNLANPSDPPRDMSWGKRMYEELFLVFFSFAPYFETDSIQPFFKILPFPTNVSQADFDLFFSTKKAASFSLFIKDFENKNSIQLLDSQSFKKGKHKISMDLTHLKKGNHYIELRSEGLKIQQLFVLLDGGL